MSPFRRQGQGGISMFQSMFQIPNLCSLATVKSDPMAKILSDECDHKYIKIIIIIFRLFKLRSVITSLFTPYYFRRLKLKRNY